jgi:hypothetical protein
MVELKIYHVSPFVSKGSLAIKVNGNIARYLPATCC